MAEQPAHRHVLLAGLAELGPVGGDRGVEVEQAAVGEDVGAHGRGALGGREDQLQRVLGVRRVGGRVGHAAGEVDLQVAADVQREPCADVAVVGEVGQERVPHPLEPIGHEAVDLHARTWSPLGRPDCRRDANREVRRLRLGPERQAPCDALPTHGPPSTAPSVLLPARPPGGRAGAARQGPAARPAGGPHRRGRGVLRERGSGQPRLPGPDAGATPRCSDRPVGCTCTSPTGCTGA